MHNNALKTEFDVELDFDAPLHSQAAARLNKQTPSAPPEIQMDTQADNQEPVSEKSYDALIQRPADEDLEAPAEDTMVEPVFDDAEAVSVHEDTEIEPELSNNRKGRPRSDAARKSILKAVNSLLLHMSVQELSMEAISKKAKVGKTTIYRWWPNKMAVVMDSLMAQPGIQSPLPTPRNNADAIELQLEKLIRLLGSKNGETISQLFSEAQGDPAAYKIFADAFLTPLLDAIQFSVEEGQKAGEFRTDMDAKMAVDIVCGPIFFRLMARPADLNDDFREAYPKEAVGLIGV